MKILTLMCAFWLAACANKVEVPAEVNTQVSGNATVNVVHSIAISADLAGIFKDTCSEEADKLGLPIDSIERNTYITTCVAKKENDLLTALLAAINNADTAQGTNAQP